MKKKKKKKKKKKNILSVTCVIVAYAHEEMNILISLLNIIVFLFYDVNLTAQDFVYLEFVKCQLSLRKNMQVFAKCTAYISAYKCHPMSK